MQDHYREFISGNELPTVPSTLEAVATRTVSLLATDAKTRKLVGVSRVVMEEEQRTKAPTKKSNVVYDILLGSKEAAEKLAGSILTIKSVRTRTEYMSACKIKITCPWTLQMIIWGLTSLNTDASGMSHPL